MEANKQRGAGPVGERKLYVPQTAFIGFLVVGAFLTSLLKHTGGGAEKLFSRC